MLLILDLALFYNMHNTNYKLYIRWRGDGGLAIYCLEQLFSFDLLIIIILVKRNIQNINLKFAHINTICISILSLMRVFGSNIS